MSAIAGGAEAVMVPEVEEDPEELVRVLTSAYERGKSHAIIVVAEGAKYNASHLAEFFEKHRESVGFELRVTVLGHVQRGGTPTFADRLLGSQFGVAAIECIENKEFGVLVGKIDGHVQMTPLKDVVGKTKELDKELFELARILD